jgi:hypothetical protein
MHSYGISKTKWKIIDVAGHVFSLMLHGWSFVLLLLLIIISSLIFIPSSLSSSSIFQTATAAQPLSLTSLESTTIKVILSDSIQALKSGNTSKALQHLNVVHQKLATVKENSSSTQTTRLLVSDAIQALRDGDTNIALIHLNLADQQLSTPLPSNKTAASSSSSQTNTSITTTSNNNNNFSTYDNPNLGIRMQYPSNWTVIENSYNSTTNNTVARFLSPSKISSEIGNVSGVSGNFVPYLDIFVFDSKNMSLDEIVKGRINYFSNNSDFVIHELKPLVLNNGSNSLNNNKQPAYMLDYTATVGEDELFRKMQVYTMFDSKVFVITFTSQQALFPNYTPIVQKMINSFVIQNAK